MAHKGFSIIEATETLTVDSIFVVLYGLPGVGKTSTAFTMPGNVLHVDSDKGLKRAVQKKRPTSFEITEYGGFFSWIMSRDFEEYVSNNAIKSVLLDTVGTLLDDLIAPWLIRNDPKNGNNTGGLSLQGWGALKTNFNVLKSRLQSLGLHTCCICHAKEEGDGNSRRFELAVSGGSTEVIYRTADLIGFVTVQGDKRFINFNPTNSNIGKNVGNLPVFTVPVSDSEEYDNFMVSVVDAVTANMTAQSAKQLEYNARLDEWRELLNSRETPADFDAFMKQASELPDGLLKVTIKKMLALKLDEKGYKYDKDLKRFVDTMAVEPQPVDPEPIEVDEKN